MKYKKIKKGKLKKIIVFQIEKEKISMNILRKKRIIKVLI